MQRKMCVIGLVCASLLIGCVESGEHHESTPPPALDEIQVSKAEKVIGGTQTSSLPEIGSIRIWGGGWCTATLIRHNVAITAAHCVGYRSQSGASAYGTFEINTEDGADHEFTIDAIYAHGTNLGHRDVALLRLAESVPTEVARPTQISDAKPEYGDEMAIYGYGCTSRGGGGSWVKRMVVYAFEDSNNLCPGDSGGPVIDRGDRTVSLINSGYYTYSGTDIFADPVRHKDALWDVIRDWNGTAEPEPVEPEPEPAPRPNGVMVKNGTTAGVWVHCGRAASEGCDGWQYLAVGEETWVTTPNQAIYLWNVGSSASVIFELRRVEFSALDVVVVENETEPLRPLTD